MIIIIVVNGAWRVNCAERTGSISETFKYERANMKELFVVCLISREPLGVVQTLIGHQQNSYK